MPIFRCLVKFAVCPMLRDEIFCVVCAMTSHRVVVVGLGTHTRCSGHAPSTSHARCPHIAIMTRPRCERCMAQPRRRIQCAWGCGRLIGPGCKRKCLLVEFLPGYGACTDCLPPQLPDTRGAGPVHHRARDTHHSGLHVFTCACLHPCVHARDMRGSLAGLMHFAHCSLLTTRLLLLVLLKRHSILVFRAPLLAIFRATLSHTPIQCP